MGYGIGPLLLVLSIAYLRAREFFGQGWQAKRGEAGGNSYLGKAAENEPPLLPQLTLAILFLVTAGD